MAHSPATLRRVLGFISPDCDRETWARVAMALKAELGDAGFPLFDEWSSGGESYRPRDALSTWRSVREGGGVGVGSLFELAKARGFRFDDGERPAPASKRLMPG